MTECYTTAKQKANISNTYENPNWDVEKINSIYKKPFFQLLSDAHTVHNNNHPPTVQLSTLQSIKTGACPEDCKYCAQSGHYKTNINKEKLLPNVVVKQQAAKAKALGASRFCMGAAWRSPPKAAIPQLCELIKEVKEMGLETCLTAGNLSSDTATQLKSAGLDYYNHNLDTSEDYYPEMCSTHTYQDRLETLDRVEQAGLKTCCGGILGLGETQADRFKLLAELAKRKIPPTSVPINQLVPIPGTPFEDKEPVDEFEFIRYIATCRIVLPKSTIRLAAGRHQMTPTAQAWCFFAGANSIFYGEKLLTTPTPNTKADIDLFKKINLELS